MTKEKWKYWWLDIVQLSSKRKMKEESVCVEMTYSHLFGYSIEIVFIINIFCIFYEEEIQACGNALIEREEIVYMTDVSDIQWKRRNKEMMKSAKIEASIRYVNILNEEKKNDWRYSMMKYSIQFSLSWKCRRNDKWYNGINEKGKCGCISMLYREKKIIDIVSLT